MQKIITLWIMLCMLFFGYVSMKYNSWKKIQWKDIVVFLNNSYGCCVGCLLHIWLSSSFVINNVPFIVFLVLLSILLFFSIFINIIYVLLFIALVDCFYSFVSIPHSLCFEFFAFVFYLCFHPFIILPPFSYPFLPYIYLLICTHTHTLSYVQT